MYAMGSCNGEIAKAHNKSPQAVSNLFHQPFFQERVTAIMAENRRDVMDLLRASGSTVWRHWWRFVITRRRQPLPEWHAAGKFWIEHLAVQCNGSRPWARSRVRIRGGSGPA